MNVISWPLSLPVGACMARFDWMLALAGSRPGGRHTFFLSRQKESKQRKRRRYSCATLRPQTRIEPAPAPRLQQWCAIAPHVQVRDAAHASGPQRSPAHRYLACRVGVAPTAVHRQCDTNSARFARPSRNSLGRQGVIALPSLNVRSNSALTLQSNRRRRFDQGLHPKRDARMVSASFFAYFLSGATERKYAARRGGTRQIGIRT